LLSIFSLLIIGRAPVQAESLKLEQEHKARLAEREEIIRERAESEAQAAAMPASKQEVHVLEVAAEAKAVAEQAAKAQEASTCRAQALGTVQQVSTSNQTSSRNRARRKTLTPNNLAIVANNRIGCCANVVWTTFTQYK
jgi:citrate synthase